MKRILLSVAVMTLTFCSTGVFVNAETVDSNLESSIIGGDFGIRAIDSIKVSNEQKFFTTYPPKTTWISKTINGLTYGGNCTLQGGSVRQVEGGYVALYQGTISRG